MWLGLWGSGRAPAVHLSTAAGCVEATRPAGFGCRWARAVVAPSIWGRRGRGVWRAPDPCLDVVVAWRAGGICRLRPHVGGAAHAEDVVERACAKAEPLSSAGCEWTDLPEEAVGLGHHAGELAAGVSARSNMRSERPLANRPRSARCRAAEAHGRPGSACPCPPCRRPRACASLARRRRASRSPRSRITCRSTSYPPRPPSRSRWWRLLHDRTTRGATSWCSICRSARRGSCAHVPATGAPSCSCARSRARRPFSCAWRYEVPVAGVEQLKHPHHFVHRRAPGHPAQAAS